MNTFLQGCCFVPPEDDGVSNNSIVDRTSYSRPSSKAIYDLRSLGKKEIFFIKKCPAGEWMRYDEEQMCVESISMEVLDGSFTNNTSSVEMQHRRRKNTSSDNCLRALPQEDINMRMSYWLRGINLEDSRESSCYVSTYASQTSRNTTSVSKLLDFISMCFWKCSPGCQQIPSINP